MNVSAFSITRDPPGIGLLTDDGEVELPALWLRERTQDPENLEQMTRQRLFNSHAIDPDLTLEQVIPRQGNTLELSFSDGHREIYDLDALLSELGEHNAFPKPEPWKSDLDQDKTRFDWSGVDDIDYFRKSLEAYLRFGFIILYNVPTGSEKILDVGNKYGYVKETNFGRYFEVYSRPSGNDLAYRNVALGPHTDNPYRDPVPGIQLLHCLANETTGGLSTLVDSLQVLEQLKRESPEGYHLLRKIPVRFRFVDAGTELESHRCIIQTDDDGNPTGVHYSPRLDGLPLLPEDETRAFHIARQRLGGLFTNPDYEIRFPLQTGELMLFDNSRVLHGRTSYDPDQGYRHLQGCYLHSDGPRERYASVVKELTRYEEAA